VWARVPGICLGTAKGAVVAEGNETVRWGPNRSFFPNLAGGRQKGWWGDLPSRAPCLKGEGKLVWETEKKGSGGSLQESFCWGKKIQRGGEGRAGKRDWIKIKEVEQVSEGKTSKEGSQ